MAGQVKIPDSPGQQAKEERGRSSVDFTYNGLDDVEELVGTVRDIGGTGCSTDALAAKMNQVATGGGFRMKLYSARTFGLADVTKGNIELTNLGLHIVDPKHTKSARVTAFLSVPLFKMMYEQLKGQPLPPAAAIERMMLQAGVAPKQKERARQVFMRSAKVAGFFEIHADRLVRPEIRDSASATPAAEANKTTADVGPVLRIPRFYGSGGGGGDDGIHPAILGLLRDLPPPGTPLTAKRKESLKQAFASNIDFIYPEPEDLP